MAKFLNVDADVPLNPAGDQGQGSPKYRGCQLTNVTNSLLLIIVTMIVNITSTTTNN